MGGGSIPPAGWSVLQWLAATGPRQPRITAVLLQPPDFRVLPGQRYLVESNPTPCRQLWKPVQCGLPPDFGEGGSGLGREQGWSGTLGCIKRDWGRSRNIGHQPLSTRNITDWEIHQWCRIASTHLPASPQFVPLSETPRSSTGTARYAALQQMGPKVPEIQEGSRRHYGELDGVRLSCGRAAHAEDSVRPLVPRRGRRPAA